MVVKSAGVVVVRPSDKGYEFLLLQSYSYLDFPKGKVDEGETELEAALRETKEESQLYDLEFKWGTDQFVETQPYPTKVDGKKVKKVARYYIAELKSGEVSLEPNPETGKTEHERFYWLTYEEAKKMPLHDRIKQVLDWAHEVVG